MFDNQIATQQVSTMSTIVLKRTGQKVRLKTASFFFAFDRFSLPDAARRVSSNIRQSLSVT